MSTQFDYIILGGGTAGCVLANRLSANPARSVLLIEAGIDTPPDNIPDDILDIYPRSYMNMNYRWKINGHALTDADSPARPLLQARVMGGGSSIMGMVMLRGTPEDYDGWAQAGADGWGWDDVLPYFCRLENDLDFDGPLHGKDGPTEIRRHRMADWPPLSKAGAAYARRMGIPLIADMNGDFRPGYGALPIAGTLEHRACGPVSYLTREVRSRPNLKVMGEATARGLRFDGNRVTGVAVEHAGVTQIFHAHETIVSMGALLSPEFLLRQGIGDPAQLAASNVETRHGLLGVGANLQNHAALTTLAYLRSTAVEKNPQRNQNNSTFRYSSELPGCGASDMLLGFGSRASGNALGSQLAMFSSILMSPASRGRVRLPTADTAAAGTIVEYNLLGDPRDQARLMDGLRRIVAYAAAPEIKGLSGSPIAPRSMADLGRFNRPTLYNAVTGRFLSILFDAVPALGNWAVSTLGTRLADLLHNSDLLTQYMRDNVMPLGHHSGTCRMGRANDPHAVVDHKGRVHGLGGLRVVDASVMPMVPRGNTNLPVLMLAEKMADAILFD